MSCKSPVCSEEMNKCMQLPLNQSCSSLTDQCNVGVCSATSGECESEPANEGGTCDDGDKCTQQDTCAGGECAGQPKTCPAPDNQCQISVCDAATGDCRTEDKPDNSSCVLGGGSAGLCRPDTCQAGQCMAGPEKDCSALNDACNDYECDPNRGCVPRPKEDGSHCSTGLFCTVNQFCTNGTCGGGSPRVCESTNPCETLRCNGTTKACDIVVPKDCSAFNRQCTEGRCNATNGQCYPAAIKENEACDDGKLCTTDTVCTAGKCAGGTNTICPADDNDKCLAPLCSEMDGCKLTPTECPSSNCLTGECNPETGNCAPKPANTSCTSLTPCPGRCDGDGTCVEACPTPPVPCMSNAACAVGECCINGECVSSQTGNCGFDQADADCKEEKGDNCKCIFSCGQNSPTCSGEGGNPCRSNGVCCCGTDRPTYEDACPACRDPCPGNGNECTGDFPNFAAGVCQESI
ncbi:hypothetical protein COO60DRAFT_1555435 [Scenedesmus sp. NREL 46B-D3]|nr:hypothetical protein COO60DRAFT_1555435 [Scenedesmus sp. NREL 46B-D3]